MEDDVSWTDLIPPDAYNVFQKLFQLEVIGLFAASNGKFVFKFI